MQFPILLADAGGTSVHWCLCKSPSETEHFRTSGINPYFTSKEDIILYLNKVYDNFLLSLPKSIIYYGAGCEASTQNKYIQELLQAEFPTSKTTIVHGDLLAVAHALLGNTAGMVGIIGTGTNLAYFDGEHFVEKMTSLGFWLGDEGSGSYFGKNLIADFLRKKLPARLQVAMEKEFPKLTIPLALHHLYKENRPNAYAASFMPFLYQYQDDPWVKSRIIEGFRLFIQNEIEAFKEYGSQTIHFTGGVAYHFLPLLTIAIEEAGLNMGQVENEIMEKLATYWLKQVV